MQFSTRSSPLSGAAVFFNSLPHLEGRVFQHPSVLHPSYFKAQNISSCHWVVLCYVFVFFFSIKNSTSWQSILSCYAISYNTWTNTEVNSCLKFHWGPRGGREGKSPSHTVYNFSWTTTVRLQPLTTKNRRQLEFVSALLKTFVVGRTQHAANLLSSWN